MWKSSRVCENQWVFAQALKWRGNFQKCKMARFFQEIFRSDPRRSSRPKRTSTASSNTGPNVHWNRNVSAGRPVTWTFDLVFSFKIEIVKTKRTVVYLDLAWASPVSACFTERFDAVASRKPRATRRRRQAGRSGRRG